MMDSVEDSSVDESDFTVIYADDGDSDDSCSAVVTRAELYNCRDIQLGTNNVRILDWPPAAHFPVLSKIHPANSSRASTGPSESEDADLGTSPSVKNQSTPDRSNATVGPTIILTGKHRQAKSPVPQPRKIEAASAASSVPVTDDGPIASNRSSSDLQTERRADDRSAKAVNDSAYKTNADVIAAATAFLAATVTKAAAAVPEDEAMKAVVQATSVAAAVAARAAQGAADWSPGTSAVSNQACGNGTSEPRTEPTVEQTVVRTSVSATKKNPKSSLKSTAPSDDGTEAHLSRPGKNVTFTDYLTVGNDEKCADDEHCSSVNADTSNDRKSSGDENGRQGTSSAEERCNALKVPSRDARPRSEEKAVERMLRPLKRGTDRHVALVDDFLNRLRATSDAQISRFMSDRTEDGISKYDQPNRCLCHDEHRPLRCCLRDRYSFDVYERERLTDTLEEAARSVSDYGCLPLAQLILNGASDVVAQCPALDLRLGVLYRATNAIAPFSAEKAYVACHELLPTVSEFFENHASTVRLAVTMAEQWYPDSLPRGIYSAVLYLDQIARRFNDAYEGAADIHLRAAATLTVLSGDEGNKGAAMKVFGVDNVSDHFTDLFWSMVGRELVLSPLTLANLGVRGKRLATALVGHLDDTDPRVALEETGKIFAKAINDQLSVSVNVTRTVGDPFELMRCMASQLAYARSGQRLPSDVCVFFDLWNVNAIRILDYILGLRPEDEPGMRFAAMVPSLFFERLRSQGLSVWSFFSHRDSLTALTERIGDEFKESYEALEQHKRGLSVSCTWIAGKISEAVLCGRLSIVFPDNIGKRCIFNDSLNAIPECIGPDLASLRLSAVSSTPVYQVTLNLLEFIDEVVPDSVRSGENMYVINGCYLNLRRLRKTARRAVVAANLQMNHDLVSMRDGAQECVRRYRTVSIGVVGFHSLLQALRLSYESNGAREVNQIVFEQIYYACVKASSALCAAGLPPFERFRESCYAKGILYCDLFENVTFTLPAPRWAKLREDVARHGMRNALLVALGPGEDAARLVGVSRSFWPWSADVVEESCAHTDPLPAHLRQSAGEGANGATHVDSALMEVTGCRVPWKLPVVNHLAYESGHFPPETERDVFSSGVEVSPKRVLQLCRERAPFVDQAQASCIYVRGDVNPRDILSHLDGAHAAGLKVGLYKCVVLPTPGVLHVSGGGSRFA